MLLLFLHGTDFRAKRHQCQGGKFEMLQTKGNPDDGQAAAHTHGNGADAKPQPAQQYPDDIQKDRAGGHVPKVHLLTKGHQNQLRKLETLQAHGNTHNRDTAQYTSQHPA